MILVANVIFRLIKKVLVRVHKIIMLVHKII